MRMTENRDLFWELLEPEYTRALMFCRKLAGDRDVGDDLYQDALLTAYTRFTDLREHASFRPWLYRVIVTTFRQTVRRPWWRRRLPFTTQVEESLTGADPSDSHAARRWLERAFQAVTPEEQALVTLYELEEWTVGELAELFGKRPGAIKTRLHRARRRMKDVLAAYAKGQKLPVERNTTTSEVKPCTATKPKNG